MCAIFGWLDYKHIVNTKILRRLTQNLANAAEERGTDASGIAYVKEGRVTIYKRPKPAHKIKFRVPDGTCAVMGHTRFATQGDKEKNYNNHPFAGHAKINFALAHNGVLYNEIQVRKSMNIAIPYIETDSYLAVQIIEKLGELSISSLSEMAEKVSGTFNFTIIDSNNTLYIVKGNNPLILKHYPALGLYVYASTQSIMDKAIKKTILTNFESNIILTQEGDIVKIDEDGELTRGIFEPEYFSPYSKYHITNPYYYNEDYEPSYDYAYLIDYCWAYGVDVEEIELLIEYGYSTDDIEELMNNKAELEYVLNYIRGVEENDKERSDRDFTVYRQYD